MAQKNRKLEMLALSNFFISFLLPILQFNWLFSWFLYPESVAKTVWCGEDWSPEHLKDIPTFEPRIGWKTTMQLVGASLTSVNHPPGLIDFPTF